MALVLVVEASPRPGVPARDRTDMVRLPSSQKHVLTAMAEILDAEDATKGPIGQSGCAAWIAEIADGAASSSEPWDALEAARPESPDLLRRFTDMEELMGAYFALFSEDRGG